MAIRTNYSLSEFYNSIRDKVIELNPKITFWGEGSVLRAVSQAVAHKLHYLQLQLNITTTSIYIKTARTFHLDRLVENFGMSRRKSTYAGAIITFTGTDDRVDDVIIPLGTTVSREADYFGNIVSYTLLENVTLPLADVSVTGLVACTDIGTIGNCSAGAINVMTDEVTGIESCENLTDVVNGYDIEDTETLRSRVPSYLLGLKRGNEDAIISAVRAVEGVTYVDIKPNFPTVGNFTVYVATALGVLDSITLEKVEEAVKKAKGYCVTYTIISPTAYPITIDFDITFTDSIITSNKTDLLNNLKYSIQAYINNLATPNLYISDVISFVRQFDGVKNIKNVLLNNSSSDLELNSLYTIKVNDITDITISEV